MYTTYIHLQLLSPNHIGLNLLRKLLTFLCCLCKHRKMQLKMSLTSVVWTHDMHLPSIFPQFFFHLNMKYNSYLLHILLLCLKHLLCKFNEFSGSHLNTVLLMVQEHKFHQLWSQKMQTIQLFDILLCATLSHYKPVYLWNHDFESFILCVYG